MTIATWLTNLNSDFWTKTNDEVEDITTLCIEDIQFLLADAKATSNDVAVATYTAELARRAA
jgi:hypothetical protein